MSDFNNAALTSARPWYRHFWPWFIFGIPALTIVAGFSLLFSAIASDDGLVADDYYKQGLAINRTLSRTDLAHSLGLQAQLIPAADGSIVLQMQAREGVSLPQSIVLSLVHPTRSGLDQSAKLSADAEGFVARFSDLNAGRWNVLIEDEAQSWRLQGSLHWPMTGPIEIKSN